MLLVAFQLFLIALGCMLIAACVYVSPLISRGARKSDAPPVYVAPLPKVIARPAICRRRRWPC